MITREPEYYTVREAADLLRVSTPTIRRWIRTGTLHAQRLGKRTIRIRSEEVRRARRGEGASETASPTAGIAPAEGRLDGRKYPQFLSDNPMPLGEWIEHAKKDLAEQMKRRGGAPFPSSLPDIHQARDAQDDRW